MNRYIFRPVLLLIISVGLVTTGMAQRNGTKKSIKTPVALDVRLPISVIDKNKQFVSDLTSDDFIVSENGRRQKVTSFTSGKENPPIFVGVMMDTSQSMQTKLDFAKEGAKNLVYTITRLRKNKAAFMTFDDEIILRQDFTDKIDLLDQAINKVQESGQRNSLYDAIYSLCDEKQRIAPGRRAIVVITDGKDISSLARPKNVIDIAQRTETVIFIVSTSGNSLRPIPNVKSGAVAKIGRVENANDEFLLQLAAESGGSMFFVSNAFELDKAFAIISKEINSQYVFTYRPTNQKHDGKERKITVRLADRKKNNLYKIRAKTKYRAVNRSLK